MQVRRRPIPRDRNTVAADLLGLVVQRLRDVADEVDEELEGFFVVGGGEAAVVDALGVVCYGGDDAAGCAAVAGVGDGAGGRGGVFGVDEAGWVGVSGGGSCRGGGGVYWYGALNRPAVV